MQHLVFAIEAGNIVWLSAHDTREEAIERLNELRPAGDKDEAKYEFAFTVESAHFVSFV
jgi:hypothetical protein